MGFTTKSNTNNKLMYNTGNLMIATVSLTRDATSFLIIIIIMGQNLTWYLSSYNKLTEGWENPSLTKQVNHVNLTILFKFSSVKYPLFFYHRIF